MRLHAFHARFRVPRDIQERCTIFGLNGTAAVGSYRPVGNTALDREAFYWSIEVKFNRPNLNPSHSGSQFLTARNDGNRRSDRVFSGVQEEVRDEK